MPSGLALCYSLVLAGAALLRAPQEPVVFDGRTLAGWEGDPRHWSVEDGCLVGRTTDAAPLERTTYLVWTGGELRDFELSLRYQLVRGNSGVQFRSRVVGKHNVAGYQADLADGQGLTGSLYEQFGRGTLVRLGERTRVLATGKTESEALGGAEELAGQARAGEWNELRIRAVGESTELFVNGVRTAVLVDQSPLRASLSGCLALQLHSGPPMEVRFRDFRLLHLGGVHDARERFEPQWIWSHEHAASNEEAWFQRVFELPGPARRATLYAVADDGFEAYLDGVLVAAGEGAERTQQVDVSASVRAGTNVLALWAHNIDGPAAMLASLQVEGEGWRRLYTTDASWRGARSEPRDWTRLSADSAWGPVHSIGPIGTEPWPRPSNQVKHARIQALPGAALGLPAGFAAELVYSVPRARLGSWVALAFDPEGRAYASDQHGFLYRVELGRGGEAPRVERVDVDLGEAQGLCWAFDALYAVVNGSKRFASGLYRLTDGDGDGRLERVERLRAFIGGDEHGPHAVVLAPDGESLYVVGGYEVAPPAEALAAWGPSFLPVGRLPVCVQRVEMSEFELTQQGAAGWVARTDREGQRWELVATGLRNAYDLAFQHGELFAFDSDMEWDLGLPWYVPTRLLHVVERADFGFRLGSARWPTWFPDSLPGVVETSRASPTGMLAGSELAFPARYRAALFAGDWLKGRILAFHLAPEGASFRAEVEVFASAQPLPVTDLARGPDGALYFVTGGRHTQSGLYRIVWNGAAEPEPPDGAEDEGSRLRAALAHDPEAALRALGESVRGSRHARHALRASWERLPWAELERRRAAEQDPWLAAELALALARTAPEERAGALLAELAGHAPSIWSGALAGLQLRTLEVLLVRLPETDPGVRARLAETLLAVFPSGEAVLDAELGAVLASLPEAEERFVPRALALLAAREGAAAFQWAFLLRHTRRGWTSAGRRAYFEWLRAADIGFGGGRAVAVFLAALRKDALATLSDAERAALGALVERGVELDPAPPAARRFVRAWSAAELEPALVQLEGERDLARGARLLREAACLSCHRIEGRGLAIGPELDGLAGRFSAADLLESILEPSRAVPDRYRDTVVTTADERNHIGRIVAERDGALFLRASYGAQAVERIPLEDVVSRELHRLSPMPEGLLDTLSLDEILDLFAFLLQ